MKYFPTFNAKDEQEANYIAGVLAMRQIETRIESVPQDGNKFVVSVPWGLESRAVSVYFGLA